MSVFLQHGDRHFDADAVNVSARKSITRGAVLAGRITEVEYAAEVNEERIVRRTAVDLFARGSGHQRGVDQRIVRSTEAHRGIFNAAWPDVRRGHDAVRDHRRPSSAAVGALLHGVGREQILQAQTDVEERGRVLVALGEGEAVGNLVARRVRVVVHVDLIPDALAEAGIVRSAVRQLRQCS